MTTTDNLFIVPGVPHRTIGNQVVQQFKTTCPGCRSTLIMSLVAVPRCESSTVSRQNWETKDRDVLKQRLGGGRRCDRCRFSDLVHSLRLEVVPRPSFRAAVTIEVSRLRGMGTLIGDRMASALIEIATNPEHLSAGDIAADRSALEFEISTFSRRGDSAGTRMADALRTVLATYPDSALPRSGLFSPGTIVASRGIRIDSPLNPNEIISLIDIRHALGDWGPIGKFSDVEITDNVRWAPDHAGTLACNALAIESNFGLVESRYVIRRPNQADFEVRVATQLNFGQSQTVVWSALEGGL